MQTSHKLHGQTEIHGDMAKQMHQSHKCKVDTNLQGNEQRDGQTELHGGICLKLL